MWLLGPEGAAYLRHVALLQCVVCAIRVLRDPESHLDCKMLQLHMCAIQPSDLCAASGPSATSWVKQCMVTAPDVLY